MRTMYDSVTPGAIPTSAVLVAGYVDGPYAWSKGDWARFPKAVKVRIATRAATNDGHVLDVEPGDATAAQAVNWVVMRRKAAVDPSIYCSQSAWAGVRAAFAAARVAAPHYWIAHYDGDKTIPAGAVAKQYADPPNTGGHYDLSAVADHWPGVDQGEPDMQLTDKLNPNPATGTVNEALNAVLFGITGIRSAGSLALAVYNIQRTVTAQSAAITALSSVIATQQTNLSAQDIQNAVATEMARVAPANGFQVAPTAPQS
jgi:hypothetical protein